MATSESTGQSTTGSMTMTFVTFGLIIVIFYFLMIRPQKKKDKEAQEMISRMKKGDKVVSIGGIHGTVVAVKESTVVVKVDDNTRIEFTKNAINAVVDSKAKVAPSKSKKEEEKVEKVEAPSNEEETKTSEPIVETAEPEKSDKTK
ncbi:MAG: preprotein translocase subunit YajC [Sphaerochaetaceae bacterium]